MDETRGTRPRNLDVLDPRTVADLAILRFQGIRTQTLPSLHHCMGTDAVRLRIRQWIEHQLSEKIGYEVRFLSDAAVYRLLDPKDGLVPVFNAEDILRIVFSIPPVPETPRPKLHALVRAFLFGSWKGYLKCVAYRLRFPTASGAAFPCSLDQVQPNWQDLFRAAFPQDTPTKRTLTSWADQGREALQAATGTRFNVRARLENPEDPSSALHWDECFDVRTLGTANPLFIMWEPGKQSEWSYDLRIEAVRNRH